MSAAKVFMGALGAVSVGASECSNATLLVAQEHDGFGFGDVAVDSKGNVWFPDYNNTVWMCPEDGECRKMGTGWADPFGIAVDDSGVVPVVYVSQDGSWAPGVKKCTWNVGEDEELSCSKINSRWDEPEGLSLDNKGNVFIASSGHNFGYGVWKCSPSFDCTVVGDSDHWPPPHCVAVDSQGNVYVTGGGDGDANYVKKCTSTGACSDFGGDWPKGGDYDNAIAVGPDNNVYISDSGTDTLIQCSPDNVCENVGGFDAGVNMVIDQNGIFYVAGPALRRVCLPGHFPVPARAPVRASSDESVVV